MANSTTSYRSINYCGCFGRSLESLRFNWKRRRYLWRASFFYNLVSWILVVGIILTFVFHYLITGFSFFVNYSCSSRSIHMISLFIITLTITTGILLILSIFLARMCNMFSNYALSHFMSTGKWLDCFGCTVKWFPWLSAVLMWLWLIIQFSSLIWVFVNSRQWCERRFDESAVNAVKNCRFIITGSLPCKLDLEAFNHHEIRECNHPDYLIKRKMIALALSDNGSSCNIEDTAVCNAFKDLIEEKDVNWNQPALTGCLGKVPSDMNDFIDEKNSSDLYKYILLFNITWSVVLVLIVALFYFIKSVTIFDAIIYQPKDPSDNIMIKMVRPFTPWTN
ncbi:uncharacterized protein BEWA_042300 [Theileria equi strain WA]|uniref:Membrane protein, putative n=1 Tax=Theileria equi strain WA TaxID=1537102 RepID=L1LFI4_THEEQ|nr:uncharacterized protein BEWA_042300 [Theileria equi strain WA]EKX74192.1 membrane protein, putative [Theileria equi strain WA]|eukprot:XP_004833644.1 uncharacterized protein BEWA_042300 [Theileria equi strain WA]